MRVARRPALMAFATVQLAACQAQVDLALSGAAAPRGGTAAKPSAAASAGATPKAPGTAGSGDSKLAGSRPTSVPARLVAPVAGVATLTGAIKVDASYMVAAGAGNLANKGGAVVAAGAGNLIGLDGGSLVGMDGGSLVGNAGNTLVGQDGGSLIGMDGGSLIGMDGGSMVAAGAGNLAVTFDAAGNMVAAGAGNVVGPLLRSYGAAPPSTTAGAGNHALNQAAAPAVAPGTQLPAAGMLVSVVSLREQRYLPLGDDGKGGKVYSVYTRSDGGFKVFVPAEERANVVVVASVPRGRDPRLAYNVVTRAEDARPVAVDDLAATTTRYVRLAITGRIAGILENPEAAEALLMLEGAMTPQGRDDLVAMIRELSTARTEAGLPNDLPPATRLRVAQRVVDLMLSAVPLESIMASETTSLTWQGRSPEPALPLLRGALGDMLAGARRRLDAEPVAFSQAFLEDRINAVGPGLPGTTPFTWDWSRKIVTPRDLTDFVLDQYLSAIRVGVAEPLRRLFRFVYGQDDPYTCNKADLCPAQSEPILKASEATARLQAASFALNVAFAHALRDDKGSPGQPPLKERLKEILREP